MDTSVSNLGVSAGILFRRVPASWACATEAVAANANTATIRIARYLKTETSRILNIFIKQLDIVHPLILLIINYSHMLYYEFSLNLTMPDMVGKAHPTDESATT